MKIIFLGTPDFAVPSLEILLRAGYDITAVITAPDKPAGRGMHLHPSAVKKYAVAHGLKVLQPDKLKNENFLAELKSLQPDLGVVVAFRKLPEAVWAMPRLGTFNLHASLLPQYRGAAPINWAIINGETETGATTFFLTHEIDTGKIIMQRKTEIGAEETAGELHDRLKVSGAELVLQTVKQIENHSVELIEQPSPAALKKAPKIFTEDCRIDFSKSVDEVFNLIRGLSPYPAAFTSFQSTMLKIFRCRKIMDAPPAAAVGSFSTDGKSYLRFACRDGWIEATELQAEGKKKMSTEEFLRGYRMKS